MKNFAKAIDAIARHRHVNEVFDDFLQLAVCAFAHGRMEDRYAEIIKRYKPDEVEAFGIALAAMIADYNEVITPEGGWDDVLGNYFETVNSSSQAQRAGQFFTPKAVCDLMARIVGDENAKNVCDPSSGSGRNLIAHSRLNHTNRLTAFYTAQDLDRRCVHMCVLNYIMHGMKGVVIHMNTLSMEIFSGYRIGLPELGSLVTPLTEAECRKYVEDHTVVKDEAQTPVKKTKKVKQPTLF